MKKVILLGAILAGTALAQTCIPGYDPLLRRIVYCPDQPALHAISFTIGDGTSVITTGDIGIYLTAAFACTIRRIDVSAKQSGSITVDVWKKAGAIPSAADKISASAPLTLSSSQLSQSGSLAGWALAVAIGDVFGFSVASATTVTLVTGTIWCR